MVSQETSTISELLAEGEALVQKAHSDLDSVRRTTEAMTRDLAYAFHKKEPTFPVVAGRVGS